MDAVNPQEVGMDPGALERFRDAARRAVADNCMYGGSFLIARHGKLVLNEAFGHVGSGSSREARIDDVYCILSTTKPITATAVFIMAERGLLRLSDRVSEHIPEFANGGKDKVTVAQVLTHRSGFATMPGDWFPPMWADWDATIQRLCYMPIEHAPGGSVHYHAVTGSWILAEIVRRVDGLGRNFAEIVADLIYRPLKMADSGLLPDPDWANRRVAISAIDQGGVPFPMEFLQMLDLPELDQAIIPGARSFTTTADLAQFYQLWLNGGTMAGERVLSPATVRLATTLHTGDQRDCLLDQMFMANDLDPIPANRGLSWFLRGSGLETNHFGSLASADTFGHAGASSIMAWADPQRELVFIGLTAGLVHESRNIPRWHLLSDLAQAAVVE